MASRKGDSLEVLKLPPANLEAVAVLEELVDCLTPVQVQFLLAYRETLNVQDAAKAVDRSSAMANYWKRTAPAFKRAYEIVDGEVSDSLESLAAQRAVHGFEEKRWNGKGELTEVRMRQDPSLLKLCLIGRLPEKYGNRDNGATNIQIIINRPEE